MRQEIKSLLPTGKKEMRQMENLSIIENELVPVYTTSTGEKVVYGTDLARARRWRVRILKLYKFVRLPDRA